jgi:hypothetical protein
MNNDSDEKTSSGSELNHGRDLGWNDVQQAVKEVFRSECELQWAREERAALVDAGLGTYNNQLERCEAAINLLAFCEFWQDWQAIADGSENNRDRSYGGGLQP